MMASRMGRHNLSAAAADGDDDDVDVADVAAVLLLVHPPLLAPNVDSAGEG